MPSKHEQPRSFRAIYIPSDGSSPIEIGAVAPGNQTVTTLLESLAVAISVDEKRAMRIRGDLYGSSTTSYDCELDTAAPSDELPSGEYFFDEHCD